MAAGKPFSPPGKVESSGVTVDELDAYLSNLLTNPSSAPYTVKLAPVNISNYWGDINDIVYPAGKFIVLDLSGCNATNNTIKGSSAIYFTGNVMNIIKDNPYITGIILPSDLKTIGEYTFKGCTRLTSITIPLGVTSIGNSAFMGCTSLVSGTFGAGSTITEENFAGNVFPQGSGGSPGNNLKDLYLSADPKAGTYIRSSDGTYWTKQ